MYASALEIKDSLRNAATEHDLKGGMEFEHEWQTRKKRWIREESADSCSALKTLKVPTAK
jgi:hypothetical protein